MPTAPTAGPAGPPPRAAKEAPPPQAAKEAPPGRNAGYARDAVALGCPMDRPLAGSKNCR
jgi:hypothetical protein